VAEKTYHGSCACGAVKYEARLDLGAGTFKCNCTSCTKTRFWGAFVKPDALRVTSGEGDLTTHSRWAKHQFCRHCGVKTFARADIPPLGGPVVALNLGALDDLAPEELASAPVQFMDGRNDKWMERPAFIAHM
jgi:hypothetical protein